MAYSLSVQSLGGALPSFTYKSFAGAEGGLMMARSALAAMPKKLCIQFARFILFSSLRAGVAFTAYKTIEWALIRSGKDKALEKWFTPKLSPLTQRVKEGLVPIRQHIVETAQSTSWPRYIVLTLDDPKPEQKIENHHIYPILKETALTAIVTTCSKVIVGGSFFDSLCSYALLRLALLAHRYRPQESLGEF